MAAEYAFGLVPSIRIYDKPSLVTAASRWPGRKTGLAEACGIVVIADCDETKLGG